MNPHTARRRHTVGFSLRRGREVEAFNRDQVSLGTQKLRRAGAEVGICRVDAMSARRPLPHRRGAVALDIEHAGHRYRIHVGYFPDGAVGEVFLNTTKQNSMPDAFAADAAILLSLLLQHGAVPAEIGHGLRRSPNDAPASLIGAVVDAAIRWDSSPGDVINAPVAGPIPLASLCEVPPLKTRLAARGYPTSRA